MERFDTSPVNAGNQFLAELRSGTAALHEQLERHPLSINLLKEDTGMENYGIYLAKMRAINSEVERRVFPLLASLPIDWNKRKKNQLLEADLGKIGFKAVEDNRFRLPDEMSMGFALGVIYVMEGSTLGGRVILQTIRRTLSLTEESGASYFAGYGSQTGRYWSELLDVLKQQGADQRVGEEMITGAMFTFEAIYNYFSLKTPI